MVSFRLVFNNPTLPENTDGYETQLHHVPGRDLEQFVAEVDAYIRWYNEKRIKISLESLGPVEYLKSLGLTV